MNGDKEKNEENSGANVGEGEELVTVRSELKKDEDTIEQSTKNVAMRAVQSRKTKGLGLFILLLLLVLVAVGGLAGYGWVYHFQPQQQRLAALEESLNRQLELSNRLSDQQQSADKLRTTATALLTSLRNSQKSIEQRLESHASRLRNLSGTSRNDWMLAEAKYLLRLASQRLLMERGTVSSLALMESADHILANIDDVDLFTVRDAVARDIISLKLAPTVDREGIYLRLAALVSAIEVLPAIPPSLQTQPIRVVNRVEPSQAVSAEQTWYSQLLFELKNTFFDLGQFIRIRYHDKPPEPLLSDQYQTHLTHNLRLMLEQSQLALLREQSAIYRQSLMKAMHWLNQYYAHYPKKDALIKEINELQQKPIVQFLPDISGSLEQLTDYIDRYHKLMPEKDVVDEQEDVVPALQGKKENNE